MKSTRTTARSIWFASAVLLALACAGQSPTTSPDLGSLPIFHGTPAPDDTSTVALVKWNQLYCSGVLIFPRFVLTAGHCLDTGPGDLHVKFDDEVIAVTDAETAPRYAKDDTFGPDDLAVLHLASDAPVSPVALNLAFRDEYQGVTVRVVGFGPDGETTGDKIGTRRQLRGTVESFTDEGFRYRGDLGSASCHGDSGGPVFLELDGGEVLAGIDIRGGCERVNVGDAQRVDSYLQPFILPFVRRLEPPPTMAGCPDDETEECEPPASDCPPEWRGDGICDACVADDPDCAEPDPNCAGVSDGAWCEGDVLAFCTAGAHGEVDCSLYGQACGGCEAADGCTCVPIVDPRCASLGVTGYCEDTTLETCDEAGTFHKEECYVCGRRDPSGPFTCLAPAPDPDEPCGDLDERGGCYGNTYVYCDEGIAVWQRCWEYGASCQASGDSFGCF